MNFTVFRREIWKNIRGRTPELTAAVVWREIQTFIKGDRRVAGTDEAQAMKVALYSPPYR